MHSRQHGLRLLKISLVFQLESTWKGKRNCGKGGIKPYGFLSGKWTAEVKNLQYGTQFFSSLLSPKFFLEVCFVKVEMLLAETRSNEWKGQSGAAATASSESLPFWRTHYLALSDLSLFNQPMSAAWLPSVRSGFIGREVGWLARDISWSVGRFVSYKIIQLCQRAVVAKVRGVCIF